MFNAKFVFYPGKTTVNYFPRACFSHSAPDKKNSYMVKSPWGSVSCYDMNTPLYEAHKEESLRCSISRTKKNIRNIVNSFFDWRYFVTFTFDKRKVENRYDYDMVCRSLQAYLRKLRSEYPDIVYIVVPERHKDGAYHFHGLFSADLPVKYAGYFNKAGGHVYHVKNYGLGFTTATLIKDRDRVSSYILKYISKDLMAVSEGRRRYWYTYSKIDKPVEVEVLVPYCEMASFLHLFNNFNFTYQTVDLCIDAVSPLNLNYFSGSSSCSNIDFVLNLLSLLDLEGSVSGL